MKRVLIVAYYFPPQPKAGALRPSYLAKHLAQFGWQPTVLTVDYPGVIHEPYRVVRVKQFGKSAKSEKAAAPPHATVTRSAFEQSLRTWLRGLVEFPDNAVAWFVPARATALALAREERFDAVLSTAPPVTAHFVGRAVAVSQRIPWVADYRDLWSGPSGPYFAREFGETRRAISYACERWLLRRATALTAPTKAHGDALAEYFSRTDVAVIPNACDRSIWETIDAPEPTEFRLCYTGKLYPRLRTPDVVFDAVARLRGAGDPAGAAARFDFFGEDPWLVAEAAERFGIRDAVSIHGEVDRTSALRAQRGAAALLLLLNTAGTVDSIEVANPGSKILEYAGSRRPILAVGSVENSVAGMMREGRLGLYASDAAQCAAALRSMHAAFLRGERETSVNPAWWPPSPRELAYSFSALLDRVAAAL